MNIKNKSVNIIATLLVGLFCCTSYAEDAPDKAETSIIPKFGEHVPTSLFGTFIKEGQTAVYVFYEYETNEEEEYTPKELGFPGTKKHQAQKNFSVKRLNTRHYCF